ncbi:zinc-binding alcohol dehydrogenase family protein [Roseomonas sp. NAR14]|uniref:Zinc-type alcohol dehydrogenase-like protein n=1 Tax=Roseomonas acroporae TaxID=2937791 RepID=A0A9X1Y4F0_9PROT|nr:zinc-binding alcohol dehydrogenase family protein [Roseomonas acroporae]MCK8783336.1 zinc-binding alcohol dehydrogenase family protein [Roseomonas acroporae]
MRAVGYTHCHPIEHDEALIDLTLPEPSPPRGRDLLIEVRAVSVNPVDTKVRRNADPAGEPRVLGFDAAGIVRAKGPESVLFPIGAEVFYAGAIDRPGSNAEFQLVDERIVGHKPKTLSFAESAALPLTAITAWEALFDRLHIPRGGAGAKADPNSALLILGGGGGVGSIAIQLARRLTGLQVLATASRPETREWCTTLGAHHVLDHGKDLARQVKALGVPVPYIFSTTHTETHWNAICEILAPQGAVCVIDDPQSLDAKRLKTKAGTLAWEYMFARPVFHTPDMIAQHRLLDEVSHLVDSGALRTTLTETFGTIDAANLIRAHALIESGKARGKVVLEGFGRS